MSTPGAYWPQPWTGEDGGPRRWGVAGTPGLGLRPGERLEVAAARDLYATDVLARRDPGELFALRHPAPPDGPQGTPIEAWVERLDAQTLATVASSPRLPGGPYWPGGIAAHADGSLYAIYGAWVHRLDPAGLDVLAARRMPVERPHNSCVVLDGGELVLKDCDAPAGRVPSTVSVLAPGTLEPVAPPLALPEPSIARLSGDGESVVAVGTETVFRLRLDRAAGRLVLDDAWRPRYGAPGRGFGWDPVLTDTHVLWMDNGRNHVDRTMRGSGDDPAALQLWWARHDDPAAVGSVELSGRPYGTESNPPAWDPEGRVVVAYDAGHAVLRAFRMEADDVIPLWRRDDHAHAGHLIVFPDTRELVCQDFRDWAWLRRPRARRAALPVNERLGRFAPVRRASLVSGRDHLVVLDLDTGEEKGRVAVPSPAQGFLFPAPGFARDVYYQSLTTVARVVVA